MFEDQIHHYENINFFVLFDQKYKTRNIFPFFSFFVTEEGLRSENK